MTPVQQQIQQSKKNKASALVQKVLKAAQIKIIHHMAEVCAKIQRDMKSRRHGIEKKSVDDCSVLLITTMVYNRMAYNKTIAKVEAENTLVALASNTTNWQTFPKNELSEEL